MHSLGLIYLVSFFFFLFIWFLKLTSESGMGAQVPVMEISGTSEQMMAKLVAERNVF